MMKIESKNNLYPHRYFTEHLMDAFEKSPWESDLNHKFSSLLIRWLKNYTEDHLQRFTQIQRLQHETRGPRRTRNQRLRKTKPRGAETKLKYTSPPRGSSRSEKQLGKRIHTKDENLTAWLYTYAENKEPKITIMWDGQAKTKVNNRDLAPSKQPHGTEANTEI
jgi:hypothetical protein